MGRKAQGREFASEWGIVARTCGRCRRLIMGRAGGLVMVLDGVLAVSDEKPETVPDLRMPLPLHPIDRERVAIEPGHRREPIR